MSTFERQQEEITTLESIFGPDELTLMGRKEGLFYVRVCTPLALVVRSEGGRRDPILHLPPLLLSFKLPPKYPDNAPPTFCLSGYWLSHGQLSQLCHRLDELYEPGQETLFTWFMFLLNDSWSYLGLPDEYSIVALESHLTSRPQPVQAQARQIEIVQMQDQGWPNPTEESSREDLAPVEDWDSEENGSEGALAAVISQDQLVAEDPATVDDDGDRGREIEPALLDSRAVVKTAPPPGLREMLVAYDYAQAHLEFERVPQVCAICWFDKPGSQCVMFAPCRHKVCRECATCYLREAAKRGALVTCPGSGCASEFPHHLASAFLTKEEFQRYDNQLLELGLAAMPDIVRCPRACCQCAVTWDQADGKLATCYVCHYAFCVECRQGYHGVEPCRFRPQEEQRLIREYTNGTPAERVELERQYGRRRLVALLQTELTETWLEDNCKPCPHCKAGIQKASGCNKMVCWRCNTHFCWLCAKQLDLVSPYNHFLTPDSPCHRLLFEGVDLAQGYQQNVADPDNLV